MRSAPIRKREYSHEVNDEDHEKKVGTKLTTNVMALREPDSR